MRDLAVLVLHLLTTFARLAGPGGARAVVAESVVLRQNRIEADSPLNFIQRGQIRTGHYR
jgi:hypothetical protein